MFQETRPDKIDGPVLLQWGRSNALFMQPPPTWNAFTITIQYGICARSTRLLQTFSYLASSSLLGQYAREANTPDPTDINLDCTFRTYLPLPPPSPSVTYLQRPEIAPPAPLSFSFSLPPRPPSSPPLFFLSSRVWRPLHFFLFLLLLLLTSSVPQFPPPRRTIHCTWSSPDPAARATEAPRPFPDAIRPPEGKIVEWAWVECPSMEEDFLSIQVRPIGYLFMDDMQ